MRHVCWIAGLLFLGPHDISSLQGAQGAEGVRRSRISQDIVAQEIMAQDIGAATGEFEKAVNGYAIVHNRCHVQGKDIEIEETAEVIARDGCTLVVRARKLTRAADAQAAGRPAEAEKKSSADRQSADRQSADRQSADGKKPSAEWQPEIEFTVYADLSELTNPVLVERQKFAQCEAGAAGVLKVSSRSEPGKTMQVTRRSQSGATLEKQEVKQTRRDLILFFSSPAAAEKARKALERSVKSCGGKEWPDEDDLP